MKIVKILSLIFIVFVFFTDACFAQDFIRLHFISIGEGETILIQTEDNSALIDTGDILHGYKLIDYLEKNNINRIKYLILTHAHLDHICGIFFLLPKFQIEKIYDNGQVLDTSEDIYRWYIELVRQRINYCILKQNDNLKLDDVNLEVLWSKIVNTDSFNENSLVIMLKYNNFRCLLTGDLDIQGERRLLKEGPDLKADILKIAHHGDQDATSKEFLKAASPKIAIICGGEKNRTGALPDKTMDLLKEKKIKIYRTDRDGNIIVTINKEGVYNIKTEN